ncbi:transcriptional regulator [Pontibacter sp. G13]|uniref:winged helix-turn-helix domain-containing protein n=1 Tax=Pontibacter sp. G13 TaxID=3074898 RepID=UPI00288A76D4|nr:transcriptional regulator [Pontibacter sp. G13]WNJ21174.1 transcriptional regulator [Pontibacter sp. G13]
MKEALDKLDKVFENRIRLGIMSLLMVNEEVHFSVIKKNLGVSDGNLASHIKMLRKHEYIDETKTFLNRKPHTTYHATDLGKKAFQTHLDALEQILKGYSQSED